MRILVPVDFSAFADYAINLATLYLKKFGGELHLFHCIEIPDDWQDLPTEQNFKNTVYKPSNYQAEEKFKLLSNELINKSINAKYHIVNGRFLDQLKKITSEESFDLVVMGSHGSGGFKDALLGSKTQKAVRKLKQNILVVKKSIPNIKYRNVLFVSGLNTEDLEAFHKFLDFISEFQLDKIHVMAVDTDSFFSQPSFIMKKALKKFKNEAANHPIETHFYEDRSIKKGIEHFTDENDIDLIAISNHHRHPLKRIFRGSHVEILVNHSNVPVLSIDY